MLGTENVKTFVLDDFDELLSMGYRDRIEDIPAMLSANAQIIVTLSSSILPDLLEITNRLMLNPVKILTEIEDRSLEGIRQFYVLVEDEVTKHIPNYIGMNTYGIMLLGVEIREVISVI